MELIEYQRLYDREEFHFWHVGRREILLEALRRHLPRQHDLKILDVGCGTGGNILFLRDLGEVTGLDNSETALRLAASRRFFKLVQADATSLPFPTDSAFDLVVCTDVLEHIPDDARVISEMTRVLKPGGLLLITAPVFPWLWSPHDEAMHHVRRYAKSELLKKMSRAGSQTVEQSYFVMPALPVTLFRKWWDKFFMPKDGRHKAYDMIFSPTMNALLLWLLRLEKLWLRYLPLPFGTSIFVVAQKVPSGNTGR